MIGKTLAHYKITEKLGAGGMGEVFRAADSKLGRDVALKMLPPGFADDPERLARFRREAMVLAQLNHPNIGAIYGFEETAEGRALVLELVEGPTLHDVIRKGPVPVAEALPIARQIAEAVEAAHERGVMHRDLKPANVKVTDDGRVKVLDFGLARALEGEGPAASSSTESPTMSPTLSPTLQSPITGALTGANVILGTAAYMSPEQARGKPVDKRCDIWAFGVILFEMLTGRSLFAGETVSDTLAAVLKTEPEWDSLPPKTPPRIVRLLRRCLERDPQKRLRDIGDARLLITEVMEGRHEEAPGAGAEAVAAPGGLRPWLAIALVLAGVVGGIAIGRSSRPAPAEPQVRRFLVETPGSVAQRPRISPDGRHIVYVQDRRLHVRPIDRLKPRVLDDMDDVTKPFWSPDGASIAFCADGKLWRTSVADLQPTVICDLEELQQRNEACWQEDGSIVFEQGSSLRRISARGGNIETVRDLGHEVQDFHGIDELPDGRGWVIIVHEPERGIALEVWTADERKEILRVSENESNLFCPRYAEPGYLIYERVTSNAGIWAVPFSLADLTPTGDPFLVVPGGGHPSASRDGTLAALSGGDSSLKQLVWIGLDGSLGSPVGQPQQQIFDVEISPDGSKVAVRAQDGGDLDLWIHDIERSTKTRLTFADDIEGSPAWSPDGETITFCYPAYSPNVSLWNVAADGSGEPQRLVPGGWESMSADGKWMVFERWNEGDIDLWMWSVNGGGEPEPFLKTAAREQNVRLSPDGKWAAYQSDASGRDEIYVKPFPSGAGQWQASIDGGEFVRWSPEGDRLFFIRRNKLYRVDVETTGGLRLSTPRQVIDGDEIGVELTNGYTVPAGGGRILASRPVEPEAEADREPQGILVVQNWQSEFVEASR